MTLEKFSDRARKVMQLANQECQKWNHEYVGTEHILLALCKEGSGCAAVILRKQNIDYCKVNEATEKLCQRGPDFVAMGKMPLTPRAKNVVNYAIDESEKMNLNYIGTEHLLLGLLRDEEGVACQILRNLGMNLDDAKKYVYNFLGYCKWVLPRSEEPVDQAVNQKSAAKQEFEEYVKQFDRNEYDVNRIFREWIFQKLDEGRM